MMNAIQQAHKLREDGLSAADIAARIGRSIRTVYRYLDGEISSPGKAGRPAQATLATFRKARQRVDSGVPKARAARDAKIPLRTFHRWLKTGHPAENRAKS